VKQRIREWARELLKRAVVGSWYVPSYQSWFGFSVLCVVHAVKPTTTTLK